MSSAIGKRNGNSLRIFLNPIGIGKVEMSVHLEVQHDFLISLGAG
jgi:hypothetical protein